MKYAGEDEEPERLYWVFKYKEEYADCGAYHRPEGGYYVCKRHHHCNQRGVGHAHYQHKYKGGNAHNAGIKQCAAHIAHKNLVASAEKLIVSLNGFVCVQGAADFIKEFKQSFLCAQEAETEYYSHAEV